MTTYASWINGVLHPPGEGKVSVDDTGFLLGLSVFESIYRADAVLYFLEDHLRRLDDGARALGLPLPLPWDVREVLREYDGALPPGEGIVRITLTRGVPGRGPTLVLGARDVVRPPDPGVVVAVASRPKLADEWGSLKSTNRLRYVLAREEAQARGAWESLVINAEGELSEGTISNLFCVLDGRLVTPPIASGGLPGVMRRRLLAELRERPLPGCPVEERVLLVPDLGRASEVFLTNSSGRVLPVVRVLDLAPELPGSEGPVVRALRRRVEQIEERYRSAVAR